MNCDHFNMSLPPMIYTADELVRLSTARHDAGDHKHTIPTPITLTREHLAALPAGAIVYRDELAAALGCCEKSIKRMEKRHQLPPPMTLGKRRAWLAGQIQNHMAETVKKLEAEEAQWSAKLRRHMVD